MTYLHVLYFRDAGIDKMLVQEPVQTAIWHCLNQYAYNDATFLAER